MDLGDQLVSCITVPHTCGPEGGSMSIWLKILNCSDGDGLFSTLNEGGGLHGGMVLRCGGSSL